MIKPNDNVWHKLNYEYCFDDIENQYRVFTDVTNNIHDIWINGVSIEADRISLEIEAERIFDTADIYAVYGMGLEWDPTELERVRELQIKKRS